MYLIARPSAILSLRETGLGDGLSFLSAPLNFELEACFTLALGLLQVLKKIFILQGIFPTQGSNPYILHWQAGSLLLSHQRNPVRPSEATIFYLFPCLFHHLTP